MRRHLLLLRFALFNVVGLGLVGATWAQGWLDGVTLQSNIHQPFIALIQVRKMKLDRIVSGRIIFSQKWNLKPIQAARTGGV